MRHTLKRCDGDDGGKFEFELDRDNAGDGGGGGVGRRSRSSENGVFCSRLIVGVFIDVGVAVVGRDNFIGDDDGGRKSGYGPRFISKGSPNGVGSGGRRTPRSLLLSRRGNGGGRRAGADRSLLFE